MKLVLDENIILGEGIFTKIFHGLINSESVAAKRSVDRDLLLREANFLKLCNHPNIVEYKGVVEFKNQVYLVMELALQGSLESHLGVGRFSQHQKLSFIQQICLGLHHIHSMGILHGDIKAGHILLKNFNQIVIADFSSAQDATGCSRQCLGLEIVPEREYTSSSDVYLLALVAYQIIEDKKSVNRRTLGDKIKNEASRPGGLNKNTFKEAIWERVLVNTLIHNPENRPTVLEFYAAFEE